MLARLAPWIEALPPRGTTDAAAVIFCPKTRHRRQMAVSSEDQTRLDLCPPACTGVFDDVACPGALAVDSSSSSFNEQITAVLVSRPSMPTAPAPAVNGRVHVKTFSRSTRRPRDASCRGLAAGFASRRRRLFSRSTRPLRRLGSAYRLPATGTVFADVPVTNIFAGLDRGALAAGPDRRLPR